MRSPSDTPNPNRARAVSDDIADRARIASGEGKAVDTDAMIDSMRRRIRKLSTCSSEAGAGSREGSRADASSHDPRSLTLAAVLEAADFAPESPRRKTSADLGAAHGDSAEQQQEPEPVQRNSVEFMQTFLDHKNLEKIPSFLMLTVHDNGVQHYDNMTLRDLLRLVQEEVSPLCAASFESPADAMAVGQVKYRDIRRLESILSAHEEPAVLVRHHVVLMLLDPIRAIVLANKMIVVIPDGADSMISMLTNEINTQVQEESDGGSEGAPFEIKAYEAILDTVVRLHRQEHGRIAVSVRESLARLRKRAIVPAQLQERMRSLKNALSSVTARVSAHRRALDELLEHDDEMAAMNITKLKSQPTLYKLPLGLEIMAYHEDIEVLIDSNFIDTASLETELELLKEGIRGAEESVLLRLDTSRNQLLIANTQIAVCGSFAAVGSLIASIFGMNLNNHHEDDGKAWQYVAVLTGVLIFLGICLTFTLLRKFGVIPIEA